MSKIDWEDELSSSRESYNSRDKMTTVSTEFFKIEDLYQAFKERIEREYKINLMADFVKEQLNKPLVNAEFSNYALYTPENDDEQAEGE